MPTPGTLTVTQRHFLLYVERYETPEYGVIVRYGTGETLMSRGYFTEAPRRKYSRTTGLCVRLTDKARRWLAE